MTDARSLTTKEVARLCRVSDATVKRWAEAGLLRSERTNGGHRRFRADEVARFQRELGLGLKQFHGDESALKATIEHRTKRNQSEGSLFDSLVAGREDESACFLINAFMQGESLPQIFDLRICSAMTQIGELWYSGELSIAQEHLATRTVLNAVQKLRSVIPVPEANGQLAMSCAVEGDFHELPTHLGQVLLESAGWEVLNFGANTPLYSLAEEAARHNPRLVCISSTILPDLERAARDFRDFRESLFKTDTKIVLGGRAFEAEQVNRRFAADFYAQTFSQLEIFAQKLVAENNRK